MTREWILVIGAGMAGLAAARALAEAGCEVTVLEASGRVGGRILTVRDGDEVIELGAEFVHGRPPELWALIEEAGLETYELDGPMLAYEDGRVAPREEEGAAAPVLDGLEGWTGPDISFAEYLAQHPLGDEERWAAIGYVEGFNAADHRVIGVASLGAQQAAEEAIEGDRVFRVADGYDRVPEYLAAKVRGAGGEIVLHTQVERVEWEKGQVVVRAIRHGQPVEYRGSRVVVTLPLGVLEQGSVEFVPVPEALHQALRLRMGQARRFTLVFRKRFWETMAGRYAPAPAGPFSFLFSFELMPRVWWTSLPRGSNAVTGWVGGPKAESLRGLSAEELGRMACAALARIFGLADEAVQAMLVGCHAHDWQQDARFGGAYSYVPAGALDASSGMTIPAVDTLYFAGEHTDTTGHWGTVHAAYRSGLRVAGQILGERR